MKQYISVDNFIFILVVIFYDEKMSGADNSQPLNTRDFYRQIYSNVCPSGEISCLREVITSSFQLSLPRNRGEKVGSQMKIKLFKDKENIVKTLSHKPPIFEIEDFFTQEECDLVIDLAKAKGMKEIPSYKNAETVFKDDMKDTFKMWNLNGDEFIDENEISYVYGKAGIFITSQDIIDMFKDTTMDNDGNGKLDEHEFGKMDKESLRKFFDKYIADSKKSKYSNLFTQQTWLWHDEDELLAYEDLFDNYHERVAALTELPKKIIEQSEPIQVVKYDNNAHYECHHDTQSLSKNLPCCQYGSSNCRLCRYLTIMVYLNDDYKGGEKCFPFADNATFSQKVRNVLDACASDGLMPLTDLPREYLKKCNLAKKCNECNLLVKPKRGKAIMWYNHLLNTQTAWMGALDAFSGHGDCSSSGEKWIANIWIDIIGDGKHELRSWKSGTNWISPTNKDVDIYTVLGSPHLKPKSDYNMFKERYSAVTNMVPDANIKIGDVKHHFDNLAQDVLSRSRDRPSKPEADKNFGYSKILKSVLLLLDELRSDELIVVADRLKNRMSPSAV